MVSQKILMNINVLMFPNLLEAIDVNIAPKTATS